jgi:hypothetical protein
LKDLLTHGEWQLAQPLSERAERREGGKIHNYALVNFKTKLKQNKIKLRIKDKIKTKTWCSSSYRRFAADTLIVLPKSAVN